MDKVPQLIISSCIVLLFCVDVSAQKPQIQRNGNLGPKVERQRFDDLNQIFGRCGCDSCNGRLEHNDPDDGTSGFQIVTRWSATAMSGGGLAQGDATILTWSIVPDGTDANGGGGFVPSNLIATFDNLFNEPNAGTPDLTNRFWHGLMVQAFDRWGELSGLEYVYEPNDDGLPNFGAGGVVGVRGDVRIGGFNIDGGGNVLAFNSFPNEGDMAIDTSDLGLFGNAGAGFRLFRNVITHENGHGIGFAHVESNNAGFLMEPFISGAFDGPQLDDVRAVQRNYGDFFEKSNNFNGNNSIANATDLGEFMDDESMIIGTDGATGTVVGGNDMDFVSIDDNSDQDFFQISVTEPSFLTVTVTPVGASYNQSAEGGGGGTPIDPSTTSNLSLAIFDSGGSLLQLVNNTGAGNPEVIEDQVVLPGNSFIRVTGTANNVQLYTLNVNVNTIDVPNSVIPSIINVDPGSIAAGDLNSLLNSDDQYLELVPDGPAVVGDAPIVATFTGFAADNIPSFLSLTMESRSNTANVDQTVSIFNTSTNMFEVVDSQETPFTDTSLTLTPDGDPQDFLQFPSGLITIDVRYEITGPVLLFPWKIRIDQLLINTLD